MTSTTHVDLETFGRLTAGQKTLDLPQPEHPLADGETVVLEEWDAAHAQPTGRKIEAVVTAILAAGAGEGGGAARVRVEPKASRYSAPEGHTRPA